jgi:hypothetical protein
MGVTPWHLGLFTGMQKNASDLRFSLRPGLGIIEKACFYGA